MQSRLLLTLSDISMKVTDMRLTAFPRSVLVLLLFLLCTTVPSFTLAEALPRGTIITVAGSTDKPGFGGDGGQATQAMLSIPWGITVDASGVLYIADTSNHRIRKVDTDGIITTIAGIGPDGFLHSNGIIGDYGSFSGDGGLAINAAFDQPHDVSLDAEGNLWVSDTNNGRVRKITPDGLISTGAGHGTSKGGNGMATSVPIGNDIGLDFDAQGNLYIASSNHQVYRVDPTGYLRVFAGTGQDSTEDPTYGDGGKASLATLRNPTGIAVDADGNVYIVEESRGAVRKVTTDGLIQTVATGLKGPQSVAVDAAGSLFITDTYNNAVLELQPDGTKFVVAGTGEYAFSGDGGPAIEAQFNEVGDVAIDADGNLFIADTGNNRIRKIIRIAAPGLFAGDPFPGSGDINRDGRVDIGDVLKTLRSTVQDFTLSPEEGAFADVNGDRKVDLKDVILILQKALHSS